jgi:hypothetical protein
MPPGVTTAVIDPASGRLATDACPQTLTEVFLAGQVPQELCDLHGYDGWWDWERERRDGPGRRPGKIRRWLDRVFGGEDEPPGR